MGWGRHFRQLSKCKCHIVFLLFSFAFHKKGVKNFNNNKKVKHPEFYLQEIADMERYIERVKKSISSKEPPLKVAETRLSKRTKVELQAA